MRWFATSSALVALASFATLAGCGSETPDDKSGSGGDSGTGASSGTTGAGGASGGTTSGTGGNNGGTGAASGGASSGTGGNVTGGDGGTGAAPVGGESGTGNPGGSTSGGVGGTAGTAGAAGSGVGGATGGTGGAAAGSGPDVDQNGKSNAAPGAMTSAPQDYLRLGEIRILNNNWGSAELNCNAPMSVFVNQDRSFGWTFQRGDCDTAASNQHPDFPQVEFGIHPFGIGSPLVTSPEFSSTTLLPLQIRNIQSASVTINNMSIALQAGGSWNITFEFWLSERHPVTDPNPGVHTEFMTFWGWQATRWPSAPGADGSQDGGSGTGAMVATGGKNYTLWVQRDNWASGWRYFQFRDNAGPGTSFNGTVQVKPLLDYLVNTRGFSPDLWVTRLEVGSEIDDETRGTVTIQNIAFEVNGQSRSPVFGP